MKNPPSHGQQGIVHGERVAQAVAGFDVKGLDGEADECAGGRGQLHVAAQTPPGGEHF